MSFDFIARPLGEFLKIIYDTVAFHNYGLAIIIFTVLVKIILFPFAVKQYKSMAKMQEIQPKVIEIQKKYKNDQEKLNIELMKVYKENNANPAEGCMPLLIQMPIFIALYNVFIKPLTYMLGYTKEQIETLAQSMGIGTALPAKEISIIKLDANPPVDLSFIGMNLGDIPSLANISIMWIIPILAATTTYLSSKISTPKTAKTRENKANDNTQSSMLIIFPIMTGICAFQFPAGLGLYWIITNLFQIGQQYLLKNFIKEKGKEAVVNNG